MNTRAARTREPFVHIPRFESTFDYVASHRPTRPVHCLYPQVLHAAASRFVSGFPGTVLYAVKANPAPPVLKGLWEAGVRDFDTASIEEIELVRRLFPEATCHFMAPARLAGTASEAFHRHGVRHFVADHPSEVARLLEFADRHTAITIRMKAFDPASVYELSTKFGAEPEACIDMLDALAASNVRAGLSFNVGSLCLHPDAYVRALTAAGRVIQSTRARIEVLDVGGGFPAPYPGLSAPPLEAFFTGISRAIDEIGLEPDISVLGEPGRALVAEGQSLLTQVILVKDDLVFLNDGIYGNLKELDISKETVTYPHRVIRPDGPRASAVRRFGIAGPTCDSLDVIPMKIALPVDLGEGDWIEFGMTGAYSNAMSTRFNGLGEARWIEILPGEPPR